MAERHPSDQHPARPARRTVAALLVAASLTLTACGSGAEEGTDGAVVEGITTSDDDGMNGAVLDEPYTWGSAELTATSGDAVDTRQALEKPLTLVFFGYTNCPDICGQVMATLAGTMTRLDDDVRDRVEVVFVTTDPARDTASAVAEYTQAFDPSFVGLTGDLDDIIEVGRSVGVGVDQGEKLPSGGYEVTHGTQVMAIDGSDEAPVYWSADVSQAQLTRDVLFLLDEG